MPQSQNGTPVPVVSAPVEAVTVYYDDLGEGTLGWTRVLYPAPRVVVVNALLQGDPRAQGVIEKLVQWKPCPAQSLTEQMFPPPMIMKGRVRPALWKRLAAKIAMGA